MTDKQLPPEWARDRASREYIENLLTLSYTSMKEAAVWIERRARELSAQQPDAARGEHCPKCNFTMSGVGHCVNCAEQPAWYGACHGVAAPYDHTKPPPGVAPDHHGKAGQRLQPARDGVDSLSGYVEYLREDKATKYSDPCNAAVQTERLRIADELEEIGASSPPQPADGEAVCEVTVTPGWGSRDEISVKWFPQFQQLGHGHYRLYLRPTRGVEVSDEMVQIANSAYQAAKASRFTITESECMRAALEAALSGEK